MLAGVISGGPKLIRSVVLGGETFAVKYDERRAFPYDKVADLIDDMPTSRDKAYHSLLAASGCRGASGFLCVRRVEAGRYREEVRQADVHVTALAS